MADDMNMLAVRLRNENNEDDVQKKKKKLLIRVPGTGIIFTICFLSCFWINLIKEVDGSVTSMPRNVAVAEGQPVILQCLAQQGIAWVAYDPESPHRQYISTTAGTSPPYRLLHESNEQYDLSFNATRLLGKRYICIEEESGKTNADYEVIVLETEPKCIVTFDERHINASCTINFNGYWAPTMQWERWTGDDKLLVTDNNLHVILGESVTNNVSMLPMEKSKNNTTPWKLLCVIKFIESGRPSNANGTNVPKYNYTWSTGWITLGEPTRPSEVPVEIDECSTKIETPECSAKTMLIVVFVTYFSSSSLSFLCGFHWKKMKRCRSTGNHVYEFGDNSSSDALGVD